MPQKPLAIKNHAQETALFRRRCIIATIGVVLLALVLLVRLAFLQIKDHRFYSTLSRHNLLNVTPMEPNRGLIFDRNGLLLAKNIPTYTLTLIPTSTLHLNTTLENLQKLIHISTEEIQQFHHIRRQYRPYQPIPLKFKLTETEVAQFYVNRYRLPGVLIQTRMLRYYPLGDTVSEVIGYVGHVNANEWQQIDSENYTIDSNLGKIGIEKYYEKSLRGKMGTEEIEINASGHVVRTLKRTPPKPGNNLYLTIDSQLQAEIKKVMGQESGAVVVLQPQTGEILALVTHPGYDPNPFVSGLSQKEFQNLLNSPWHPLYNRAIRGQFAAGSTIKPFFALAGLDENIVSPHYQVFDPGWFQLPNTQHVYHDWQELGHGWVNLYKALIVSCDIYFYHLANHLGIRRMVHVLQQFGFGQPTGIDMPGEAPGLVPSPQWKRSAQGHAWYTGDTIETGIGQGFLLATPLQLAQATAILAGRGERFKPHLLLKSIAPSGTEPPSPIILEPPVILHHPQNWNIVIQAMASMVDSPIGTAEFFGRHPGFTVAAKTGTAQVYGHQRDEENTRTNLPKNLRNNHLFIAFAPIHNPTIVIAVIVEHAAMADKMAGEILNYYFQHAQHEPNLQDHHDE